jgi:hypothetical protein
MKILFEFCISNMPRFFHCASEISYSVFGCAGKYNRIIMADGCVVEGGLGSNFKLIKQGAEAKLYTGIYLGRPTIVKERFKKSYRHVDLDNRLTKERMKSEARAILKCKAAGNYFPLNFPTAKNKIFVL